MKKLIKKKTAGKILIILLSALILFHLFIIFKIIPSDIVWAGQVNENNFLSLEVFAIFLTLLFIFIAIVKSGFIKNNVLEKISSVGIWIMIIYFFFNVISNSLSKSTVEKIIFIPLSLILAVLSIRLSMKNHD